jgi:hypothetical protein
MLMKTCILLAIPALLIGHENALAADEPSLVGSSSAKEDSWRIPADKKDFHIFLLMGQSNMAGGIKKVRNALKSVPDKVKNTACVQTTGLTYVKTLSSVTRAV